MPPPRPAVVLTGPTDWTQAVRSTLLPQRKPEAKGPSENLNGTGSHRRRQRCSGGDQPQPRNLPASVKLNEFDWDEVARRSKFGAMPGSSALSFRSKKSREWASLNSSGRCFWCTFL